MSRTLPSSRPAQTPAAASPASTQAQSASNTAAARSTTSAAPSAAPVNLKPSNDGFVPGGNQASRPSVSGAVGLKSVDLNSAPANVDLPDPTLMNDQLNDTTYTYEKVRLSGPLFNLSPSPNDIHQGMAGDCYFLSSLAAIANSEPSTFKHLIYSNHDGTYTVLFHQRDEKTGQFHTVPVKVDTDFYTSVYKGPPEQRTMTYDAPTGNSWSQGQVDTPSMWGPLLEKAFAQLKGNSYEAIGQGGWPYDAMEALLGRTSAGMDTTQSSPDQVWSFIKSSVDTHSPICASTFCDPDKQAQYTNTGIVGQHAYTVMGYTEQGGQKLVQLRNPWGNTEPQGNGPDDGVFSIPLADFMKYYQEVDASPRGGKYA